MILLSASPRIRPPFWPIISNFTLNKRASPPLLPVKNELSGAEAVAGVVVGLCSHPHPSKVKWHHARKTRNQPPKSYVKTPLTPRHHPKQSGGCPKISRTQKDAQMFLGSSQSSLWRSYAGYISLLPLCFFPIQNSDDRTGNFGRNISSCSWKMLTQSRSCIINTQ